MLSLYYNFIYYPLLNLLVYFYSIIPDIGVVIIVVTVLIRLLLAPSFHKSLKSQKAMTDLQPKLNELREKYKDDKEGQAKAMMQLYSEHKINPFASCLPLLLQLPILIALYHVFDKALRGSSDLTGLYSFVPNPGTIDPDFLGLINLANPSIALGVVAGLAQFWQSRMMMAKQSQNQDATARMMSMQTMYILPIISVVIAARLPAGLPLYWIVTTLFAIAQQYYILKKHPSLQN